MNLSDILSTMSIHTSFLPVGGWELTVILFIGWVLDLCLGDPTYIPHPVIYMGRWIAFGEKKLNKGTHRMFKGALFAIASIIGTFVLIWSILSYFTLRSSLFTCAVSAFLVFMCLAGHTLRKEVRMVFEALERGLDDGRRQVARIVGRDTQNLSAQEVRTAALETLAENLSDGVIAPLFWFCLLGVPGMMAYKMVNTLDSMIGYQNERYKDFGCWAARIDDIANYIPARITALLILIASIFFPAHSSKTTAQPSSATQPLSGSTLPFHRKIAFLLRYGNKHASPNSGWPEAALAAVLNCRFGGTHDYFGQEFYKPYIGDTPRQLNYNDMRISNIICFIAELLAILISLIIFFSV